MKKIIFGGLFVISATILFGQVPPTVIVTNTITGNVTGYPDGEPLIGVRIIVKENGDTTTTDLDGNYTLNVSPDDVLVFSYPGFLRTEEGVRNRTRIDVQLISTRFENVVVVAEGRKRCVVENTSFFPDSSATTLRVERSRDPNYMTVYPEVVTPGAENVLLNYEVHFQNTDTAGVAYTVRVVHDLDEQVQNTSLTTQGYYLNFKEDLQEHIEFKAPKLNTPLDSAEWQLKGDNDRIGPILKNVVAGIPPEIQYGTKGSISFSVKVPGPLEDGDRIKAVAVIYMDDQPVSTEPIYTVVRKPERLKLPSFTGIIGGINAAAASSITGNNGYFGGITFSKSRGLSEEMSDRYRNSRYIPVTAFPEWWYQAEIHYNRLVLRDEFDTALRELELTSIDIVPLQVRYVPKTLRQLVGISGGLFGAYYLNAKINDQPSLSSGFADRVSYGWFADLRLLNNIGSPGISIGYRINTFLQAPPILDPWPNEETNRYFSLYLHFMF